ncbi:hypothetical protein [Desulfocurvus sp.]|jgi:hypothetical protein|uniref:hypothetical protein n=1 Tax=Desulfocurvus sp. TaxID=2871698 RepID=UPI0025C5B0D1|nr:hypothetical protein [Desulfocurvus sp.]MCK9239808.1 hypothetical protein [Desulfocurvus sp.]
MSLHLDARALDRLAEYARSHDTGGIWVSDGRDTRCVCPGPDSAGAAGCGGLALAYPLGRGLTLLVGVGGRALPGKAEQGGLRRLLASLEHHVDTR